MIKNLTRKYDINMENLNKIINDMVVYDDIIDLYIVDGNSDFNIVPLSKKYGVKTKEKSFKNYIDNNEKIVLLSHVDYIFKMRYDESLSSLVESFNKDMSFKDTFSVIYIAEVISRVLHVKSELYVYKINKIIDNTKIIKTKDMINLLAEKYNSNPNEYAYMLNIIELKC